MLNKIVLVGRPHGAVESRTTPGGKNVTTLLLEVQRGYNDEKDLIPVVAWEQDGDILAQADADTVVTVSGRLQIRKFEQEGQKHEKGELVASQNGVVLALPHPSTARRDKNEIVVIGRLTKDPELRYTNAGKPVTTIRLAIDRGTTSPSGDKETDFIDVTVWDKQAESVANYLQKGRLVAVVGRVQVRSFDTQDGQHRERTEIVAVQVRFLDRGQEGAAGNAGRGSGTERRDSSGGMGTQRQTGGGMGAEPNFQDDDDVPF